MEGSETQKYETDLKASALEERPAEGGAGLSPDNVDPSVDDGNEEEDVAYDEEPEEVQAEADGPSLDERSQQDERVEQVLMDLLSLTSHVRCPHVPDTIKICHRSWQLLHPKVRKALKALQQPILLTLARPCALMDPKRTSGS